MNEVVLSYIIRASLGDGNLSNPNGRATRLRITCDSKYPKIKAEITQSLQVLFPNNRVSVVNSPKDTYCNVSVYSNKLNDFIPWRVGEGSKFKQQATVPAWIKTEEYLS